VRHWLRVHCRASPTQGIFCFLNINQGCKHRDPDVKGVLIYWLWLGSRPHSPDAPRLVIDGPFVPHINSWEPCYFAIVPMAPRLTLLMSSGSKKKEPRYTCLWEAKASHSQRMWAKVSSSVPHLLQNGMSDSHIRWSISWGYYVQWEGQ
jgi:hypothetical protein